MGWVLLLLPFEGALGDDPGSEKIDFFILQKKKAETNAEQGFSWNRLDTRYTVVQYKDLEELKKFDRKIDFSPSEFSLKGLFAESSFEDMMGKIKIKIDALHERVQEILDMRKKSDKKVTINLYNGKKELAQAYQELFGSELRVRAWYIYELNTIYININDVDEGMLAHELAHAVIDHYLTVRPPRASAEILAVYVDTHLFRKTKKYGAGFE